MQRFGLSPETPLAVVTIAFELVASLMVITGIWRWAGALGLAAFTLFATSVANRYWDLLPPERLMAANGFYEHLGLAGGFLFVAWQDMRDEATAPVGSSWFSCIRPIRHPCPQRNQTGFHERSCGVPDRQQR